MLKSLRIVLSLNAVLLVAILLGRNVGAQQPPQANSEGVPYLAVNINPTNVPPMVNINPFGGAPKVDVAHMPPLAITEPVRVAPSGCSDRQSFQTEVGRTISGPMVVTYLNIPAQTQATLGNQRLALSGTAQLASAIYLRDGQQFSFDHDVIYSGCKPL